MHHRFETALGAEEVGGWVCWFVERIQEGGKKLIQSKLKSDPEVQHFGFE